MGDNFLSVFKGMVEAGTARREIAAELGMTRNAVCGLVWRQGLSKPRPQRPRFWEPPFEYPEAGGCMFPIGHPGKSGFGFCGAYADHHSYCNYHRGLTAIPGSAIAPNGSAQKSTETVHA